jgi:HEPN domain-containing protein
LSTPEHREVAVLFLGKAGADLAAAELLAEDPGQDDGVIGFHAQQAVEKSLKAVLAHRGREIPRTHDLDYLAEIVAEDVDLPSDLGDVAWLNPWAVTMRYDESGASLDRDAALAAARATVSWARSVLKPA